MGDSLFMQNNLGPSAFSVKSKCAKNRTFRLDGGNAALYVVGMDEFKTPGQMIDALLTERGWSQYTLALVLGVDRTVITKLISGKRAVDAEMALLLGETFNLSPEAFLDLQKRFELAKARIVARPDPRRATRAQLYGELPVEAMIERGWLKDVDDWRDIPRVETALAAFFGVSRPEEIETLPHAAKKTHVSTPATPAQIAWICRVKAIANDMMVARYSPAAVKVMIPKLKGLLLSAEEARKAPRALAEAGVRFVIVETLPSAKIDGVTLWLNDFSPVIGMSLRHDRMDNFWFVLRHEIEHVLRGHGRMAAMLDAELEGDRVSANNVVSEEERVANEAAADFCVPATSMAKFITKKAPSFAERDLLGFARTLKIHPALVAGQLQRHTGRYDRFKQHQVKIRSIVAPSAIVDGWGDVAPVDM